MVTNLSPADPFRAIADPTRREILSLLDARPMPVNAIAAHFAVSRPAISKHLRLLSDAGLVRANPAGSANVYSLERDALREVALWLDRFWPQRLDLLKRLAEGDG